ncbi:hypothetical protein ACFWWT_04290 [Streptomyces sp. NPDC058676]|uniref:hypothetical protein n=1 Tax=Streptomyces sp. NPDC058676 TaxID=3346593 RepID=UPI003658223F
MSAYSTAYKALTSGRAMRPGEAAQLLADLRRETGEELADAVEAQMSGQYLRAATDTDGLFRMKRRKYAAAMSVLTAFRALARASRPDFPHQRNRSTS